MARRIGMDVGQYHRLEHSHNADPSFATVVRIARELNVSLDWLALTITADSEALPSKVASKKILLAAVKRIQDLLEGETPDARMIEVPIAKRATAQKRKTTKRKQ